MRRLAAPLALLALLVPAPLRGEAGTQTAPPPRRSGVAVILTGAAARIPQEAALLEELDSRGELKDLVFVSGVSSGALNAVALNAIHSGRMTWARYKEILFGIRGEDIFVQAGKRIPVDTLPARALFSQTVEREMGFRTIGDLPLATSISITRLKDLGLERTAYRMCSRRINAESDPGLGLVDILMASTAFPLVFPPARIKNATTIPDIDYVDGGAGADYIPYEALIEFEASRGQEVERAYIISRKSDSSPDISEELRGLGLNDHRLLDRLGLSFDRIANRRFTRSLERLAAREPGLASRCRVWKPDFPGSFLLFDFGTLEAQYEATRAWAKGKAPEPLAEYVAAQKERARHGQP